MTVIVNLKPSFDPPTRTVEKVCTIKEVGVNIVFETFHGALPGSDAYLAMQQTYGPDFSFDSEEARTTYASEFPIASVASLQVQP
jgi:hypothetical protein